ncbi:aminopeptidase [Piscinibacter sp. XHJ-5]|uniref:aminopeptidase n=1 Tax=Piscinibacter sp. XHJ-5 TaxID=3037797 RepID=UPI0024529904|nr:aminopeptidase [Piscinibacter sp. XHJ-5]
MAGIGLAGSIALAAVTICIGSGCSSIGYYAHSVGGHLDLLRSARPVPQWMSDEDASATLKERLALTQRIRDFAVSDLQLPDNASYRRYADLKRNAAVWNVVAAPELSLTLKTWCFPVVGCVGYRGYFERERADAFAEDLRRQGLEVSVYGVPAYSTLGAIPGDFFADPLLNTFIQFPEGELARLIFHELAHQVAYAKGDTDFNESFATAVERIGGARWLSERAAPQAREEYERFDGRRRDFRTLTKKYRDRFEALYASDASDDSKRAAKARLMQELRAEYEAIKASRWAGFSGYDAWFSRANNAGFGVLAAYTELVPDFEKLFQHSGGDFKRFYAEVRRLADLPTKAERRAALASLGD